MAVYSAAFIAMFLAFWLARGRAAWRVGILVVASYAFYANWNPYFAVMLLLGSLVDFALGRRLATLQNPWSRRAALGASLALNLGVFIALKYVHVLAYIPMWLGADVAEYEIDLTLPLGVLFYFMQSAGYVIDVYRRRTAPVAGLLDYLAYVAFFPRLFAGPLLRAEDVAPQLAAPPHLDHDARGAALFLLASGLVKKVVFADYLAINLVDKVFDLPLLFSTTEVILAIYGYALQLYCELSAYTDIALALGLLVGLRLPENFRFPFQATNLREFWRRWFVTLSAWFRDYVYLPLGGSRVAAWRVPINLVITMLLVGLWSGLAWTFVIWGLFHGLALAVTRGVQSLRRSTEPAAWWLRALGVLLTTHLVVAAFAVYRSTDLTIVENLWTILGSAIWGAPNLSLPVILVLAAGLLGAWFPQNIYKKLHETYLRLPLPVQAAIILLILLGIYRVSSAAAIPFVYERF